MTSPLPDNPGALVSSTVTASEAVLALPRVEGSAPKSGRLLRHVGYFFGASLVSQAINMVRSFSIPFILTPAQLGVWNLMNVVIGYAPNAHLGLLHGMNKALPRLRAQEEHEKADALRDSAMWVTAGLGVLACGVTLVVALLRPALTLPLMLTSVVVFVQLPYTFQFCLLRAESRFPVISQGFVVQAILSTGIVIGLGMAFTDHLVGALVGLVLAWVATTVFLFVRAGYSYRMRTDWRLIRTAFVVGAPLAVMTTADSMFMSIDRWVIAGTIGREALGYYALGVMASGVLSFVPNSLFQVMFPELIARYARTGDPRSLGDTFRTVLIGISAVMLVLIIVAGPAIKGFIELALPAYGPAAPVAQLLVVGTFFLSLAWISNGFIVAIDKQRFIVGLQVAAAVVGLSLDLLLLRMGAGVVGIAVGTVVSYAVLGIGAAILAGRAVLPHPRDVVRLLFELVSPLIPAIATLYVANRIAPATSGLLGIVVTSALTILASLAAAAGVVWRTPGTVATLRSFAATLRRAFKPDVTSVAR